MKRRNEAARALSDPRFKPKVKPPKKGRKAYRRKGRDNRKVPGPSSFPRLTPRAELTVNRSDVP
ncbi:hypothetical protein [Rhodovibrio sodomensis]|uniref:hypothetical protein n=1 Tax=Rhodovibrio sodomensis TaxID=1088 RepID=UPI0019072BDF|nr:hypothetical protein [Rhodovibrio sodomensis]